MAKQNKPDQETARVLSNRDLLRFLVGAVIFLAGFFLVVFVLAHLARAFK